MTHRTRSVDDEAQEGRDQISYTARALENERMHAQNESHSNTTTRLPHTYETNPAQERKKNNGSALTATAHSVLAHRY